MKTETKYLHFMGEIRGIGSGRRQVEIRRGTEWVYIRPVSIVARHWRKMRRAEFERLFEEKEAKA